MKYRPGITLVEVLVAIFIMGVGMLALLVLFPLGAINVIQALKDDRTSQAATNAAALANAKNLRHDTALDAEFNTQVAATGADLNAPSSAVYIDPHGIIIGPTIGAMMPTTPGMRRIRPSYAATALPAQVTALTNQYFTLLDDLNFDVDGAPVTTATEVQRYGKYTWAYLARRPRLGDERVVELTVVVYSGRPLQSLGDEKTFAATALGANSVSLPYGANKPKLRKGGWILDVTNDSGVVRGFFYRVVDLIDDTGSNTFTLELQHPIKAGRPGVFPPSALTIVVPENVSEVFDRGTGFTP